MQTYYSLDIDGLDITSYALLSSKTFFSIRHLYDVIILKSIALLRASNV